MNEELIKQHEEIFEDFLTHYKQDEHYGLSAEKDVEHKVSKFIHYFNEKRISEMGIDQYIIGTGSHDTFCYRLERELRGSGSILGSTSKKFGVYHPRNNSKNYEVNTKYNSDDPYNVYEIVKNDIKTIIDAAKRNDPFLIKEGKVTLPYTVKFKIYNTYNRKNDLPIFSYVHLRLVVEAYDIEYNRGEDWGVSMRQALLDFKNSNPVFSKVSNQCFMAFLYSGYSKFGLKESVWKPNKNNKNEEIIEIKVINGLEDIEEQVKRYSDKNPNWDEIAKRKTVIGEEGQKIVLRKEKADKPTFKDKIKDVSKDNSLGYDILSFNPDGSELHIEVKTKVNGSANNINFYITSNELERMENDPSYCIYYVCGIKRKHKTIYVIGRQYLETIKKTPIVYLITAKSIA